MLANVNNIFSTPTSAVFPVQDFAGEDDVCSQCHSNAKISDKGKPLKLVACSHLTPEGSLDHVMHAKCLRTWIKHMQNLGQALPFGFVKCFHCQVALDQTGINNEVFESKIPKGLFARTMKLFYKAPGKVQQTTTAFLNFTHTETFVSNFMGNVVLTLASTLILISLGTKNFLALIAIIYAAIFACLINYIVKMS